MTRDSRSVRPISRRRFLKLAGGAMATLALAACAPQTSPTPTVVPSSQAANATPAGPRRGGVLRMAPPDVVSILDPLRPLSYAEVRMGFILYETLTQFDFANPPAAVRPGLAESWQASADGLTWTFKLRQGVKFHHGTPFTAQDVVYTFKKILDPQSGSLSVEGFRSLDTVEAVDDATVRFHLKRPNATFPRRLALAGTQIVPHDRTDEQLANAPSGTGPFRWGENVAGQFTTFPRNDAYWQPGLPYLDQVRFVYLSEPAAQLAALTSGAIDLIDRMAFESVAAVSSTPTLRLLESPFGLAVFFSMQTTSKPFDDVRVRQAFKLAMDRPGLIKAVYQGRGTVMNDQPVAPTSPYWANLPIPERNIAKAKELLAAAGYANGLDVTLYTAPIGPGFVEAAVAYQEMAKAAGINVKVERTTPDTYFTNYLLQVPFFMDIWPTHLDADQILELGFYSSSAFNEAAWQRPDLDALIDAMGAEQDQTKRKAILAQAQRLISEEGGVMIPCVVPILSGMRREVQNLIVHDSYPPTTIWLAQG
ncbi:MAG: twin-arginine translocation signal domain-containing protein [Anaerolineae bacterium]|nr:twin-arginine translocation signal domain-containing protein [Anaerolineae bacterium]